MRITRSTFVNRARAFGFRSLPVSLPTSAVMSAETPVEPGRGVKLGDDDGRRAGHGPATGTPISIGHEDEGEEKGGIGESRGRGQSR